MSRKISGRNTHNLTVSIPIEYYDRITKIEAVTGLTRSRIVTLMIKQFLTDEEYLLSERRL